MPLKPELLKFLSRIPSMQTVPQRKALLAAVGLDRLGHQITWEGTSIVFSNELLELLGTEGQNTLADFLRNLADRDLNLVGWEDSERLIALAEHACALTPSDWSREFWGLTDTKAVSLVPFVLSQLDVSTFTGREEQLQRLETLLSNSRGSKVCSIVGLSGGGGIGKSALACHFATIHRDKFPDGIIGLRVDGKDVDTVAREFVRHCGERLDIEDGRDAATLMQEVFAHRQMLLIFDNAKDASISKLRPGGNQCAVIITTRNRALQTSASFDIPSEAAIDLEPLPEEDSLKLLNKILGDDRVEAELSKAYELIRLLGNLPLALQIVGAYLKARTRSLADYTASLQQEKTRLTQLEILGDENLNVKASINLSLNLLNDNERYFFACLSACAEEGFARRTAMAVGGCKNEWEANDYLDKLYELSLLNHAEIGKNRFVLHPLVRVYAEYLAQEQNLLFTARERHARFFMEWLQTNDLANEAIISEVATNLDDVILATEWLQTHEAETVQGKIESYEFVLNLQPLFEQYGYWQKAIALMTRFQTWAEQFQDWNAVVRYQMHEARYWSFVENFQQAEEILIKAQGNLKEIKDLDIRKRREAKILNVLAGVYQKQSKVEESIQVFRDQILIDKEIGDLRSLNIVYSRLGKLLQTNNRFEEAQQCFEQGIESAKVTDDQYQLSVGLLGLGDLFQEQGDAEKAQQVWSQAITITRYLGKPGLAAAYGIPRAGKIFRQGNLSQALQILILISDFYEDIESNTLAATLRGLCGELYRKKRFNEALVATQTLIKVTINIDPKACSIAYNRLGDILRIKGELEEAQQAYEKEIEIAKAQNDQAQIEIGLQSIRVLVRELRHSKMYDEALQLICFAINLCLDRKDEKSLPRLKSILGKILQKQGKFEEARQAFLDQIEISKALKDLKSTAIGWDSLGSLLKNQSNLEEAKHALEEAISLHETIGNQKYLISGLKNLGDLLVQQGKVVEAQEVFKRQIFIAKGSENYKEAAIISFTTGNNLFRRGYLVQSLETFLIAVDFHKSFDSEYLVKILRELAEALCSLHGFREAMQAACSAMKICLETKDKKIKKQLPAVDRLLDSLKKQLSEEEAKNYCSQMLTLDPSHQGFLRLHDKLQLTVKTGVVLFIRHSDKDNSRWGKIMPDDGDLHIIFNEKFIGSASVSKLDKGTLVEVKVREINGKLYATQVRVIRQE